MINGLLVKIYPGGRRGRYHGRHGISVATMLLPPLVGVLMAQFGWRPALLYPAMGLLLVLCVLVLAGYPGQYRSRGSPGHGGTEAGIYRRPEFWLIGLCVAMALNVSLVIGICYPPHFVQSGFSIAEAGVVSVRRRHGRWWVRRASPGWGWGGPALAGLRRRCCCSVRGIGLLLMAQSPAAVLPRSVR